MSVRQYRNLLNKIHIEKAPPAVVLFLYIKGNAEGKDRVVGKFKKIIKSKFRKLKQYLIVSRYASSFYKSALKEDWILIDSRDARGMSGSLLAVLRELTGQPEYEHYRIYVACTKGNRPQLQALLSQYQVKDVILVVRKSFRFAYLMGCAGYLFYDRTFPEWYTKREGQVLINTWHGTPVYPVGKDNIQRAYAMGDDQRSLLMADYLACSSDYMKEVLCSAFYLDNLYRGEILCCGAPGNGVFFDRERQKGLRQKLYPGVSRLYSWLPVKRSGSVDGEKLKAQMERILAKLDGELTDGELLLVQLHPSDARKLGQKQYRHIQYVPTQYDLYEILSLCDCLVTDDSPAMFDFACTGRKIILFREEEDAALQGRSRYLSDQELPFPVVGCVEDLWDQLRREKQYDDDAFRSRYCQYDGKDAASLLCRRVLQKESCVKTVTLPDNGRDNVLIYGGSLGRNGITTAMQSLLEHIDLTKRNYYVAIRSGYLKGEPERICMIPEGVGVLPMPNMVWQSLGEEIASRLYFKKNNQGPAVTKRVDRFYSRLYRRYFGGYPLDWVINFFGYEKDMINMFLHADGKRMIFVHNDMLSEIRTKGNQHEPSLRRAYATYERVAPVTEDIYGFTRELCVSDDNLLVVNSCHNDRQVLEKAQQPLAFDDFTESTVGLHELQEILSGSARKIITIGRFSDEKGHDMLMEAFEKYQREHPDSYLIIIGGYGPLYEKTRDMAASLPCKDHIVIIKAVSNPMPILKQCDVFVLSSRYEALGLVLLEADTLGIPVISTDIPGPRGFLTEHGGFMVPMSADGLYEGLKAFDEGKVKPMNVDYEAYNRKAVAEFESLF